MSAPSFDPGAVHIALHWRDGAVCDAAVRVVRPAAAAILRGRHADEAVRIVPLLYAICGAAQTAAARLALAAARGEARAPAVDAAVLAEAQREHLWRLLLDWPQALGMERQEALFAAGRKRLLDGTFGDWLDGPVRGSEAIAGALRALPQASLPVDPVVPPLDAARTLALWPRLDAGFADAPEYRGAPASTGALARHPELGALGPLAARVMARAADLADPAGLGTTSAANIADGVGRAAVETARGLLLHEVVLEGDRIADYVIVAPTEWNFHPAGALKSLLERLAAPGAAELEAAARRAVLAFDPCVRAEVAVAAA